MKKSSRAVVPIILLTRFYKKSIIIGSFENGFRIYLVGYDRVIDNSTTRLHWMMLELNFYHSSNTQLSSVLKMLEILNEIRIVKIPSTYFWGKKEADPMINLVSHT